MENLENAFMTSVNILILGLAVPLGILLFVGLFLAVLQSATQVQEQLLTFFPKILVGFILIYIAGGQFMTIMSEYLADMIRMVPHIR